MTSSNKKENIVKKWEQTGLLTQLNTTQEKRKMAHKLESIMQDILKCKKYHSLADWLIPIQRRVKAKSLSIRNWYLYVDGKRWKSLKQIKKEFDFCKNELSDFGCISAEAEFVAGMANEIQEWSG